MGEIGAWLDPIRPNPGESVASIAVRLAPCGVASVGQLLRLGLDLPGTALATLPERDDALRRLAVIGSFDFDDLKSRCWQRTDQSVFMFGREMPADWLVADRRRVAPGRLAKDKDEAWIPTLWQIRAFPCDPGTGEALIERCPDCKRLLYWSHINAVWQCAYCGYDLRKAPPRFVPNDVLERANALARVFDRRDCLSTPINHLVSERSFFAAMSWFGHFRELLHNLWLKPSAANALVGYEAVMHWPISFDYVVETFLNMVRRAERVRPNPNWFDRKREEDWQWESNPQGAMLRALRTVISRADGADLRFILMERAKMLLGFQGLKTYPEISGINQKPTGESVAIINRRRMRWLKERLDKRMPANS
jgi:predicted RNA-binding Zn-ribbon protein involved in translation (DUF1610 family)